MSNFADMAAEMNAALIGEFGDSTAIQQGALEASLQVVFTPSPGQGEILPSTTIDIQFRRSDLPFALASGAKVTTSDAEYRVVDVDPRIEDWTHARMQKVKNL